MYLENLVINAQDPPSLGRFWQALLGGVTLTDEPDLFETRITVPDGLGARQLDIGQHEVPWVVLADPEGNPFCVVDERADDATAGPIAALRLDSADPVRDAALWAELSGWQPVSSASASATAPCPSSALRHPSGRGVVLELCRQVRPKDPDAKNRLHLDIRLEPGEDLDAVVARVVELGGRELDPGWGQLPWRVVTDPSGNELCLLPARAG